MSEVHDVVCKMQRTIDEQEKRLALLEKVLEAATDLLNNGNDTGHWVDQLAETLAAAKKGK